MYPEEHPLFSYMISDIRRDAARTRARTTFLQNQISDTAAPVVSAGPVRRAKGEILT